MKNLGASPTAFMHMIDDAKSDPRGSDRAAPVHIIFASAQSRVKVYLLQMLRFSARRVPILSARTSAAWRADPGSIAADERPLDPGSSLRFGRDDNLKLQNKNARPEGRAFAGTKIR
ncbi:MAG: hypothetical protein AB7G15_09245 [Alphaproteobacteria bacterium]